MSLLKKKVVLVIGADGFIGAHLTEMLVKCGAKVKTLSYYNSFNYWGWLEDIDCLNDIEVLTGDVRDPHYCKRIIKDLETKGLVWPGKPTTNVCDGVPHL